MGGGSADRVNAMSSTEPGESAETGEFTLLLGRFRAGETHVQDQLMRLVYADLRRIAHRHLAGNAWMGTLNTTSIVHESYLRLVSPAAEHVSTRNHFLNLASRVMRQILCDYARRRLRDVARFDRDTPLEDADVSVDAELNQARQIVMVEEALRDLARTNERQVRIVECRFFAGLSEEETAAALEISVRTVQRGWNEARTWLAEHMREP